MTKLTAFNFITINGFYKDLNNDMSWHTHGEEENQYSIDSLKSDNMLLFGRITYQMMASFWPTEMGNKASTQVAEGMNNKEKIVFSKTLLSADWKNTRVCNNLIEDVKKLKKEAKSNMTILGSGSIITQLAEAGLIDAYQIMIDPIAIESGTPIFNGIKNNLKLKFESSKNFKSGVILINYSAT